MTNSSPAETQQLRDQFVESLSGFHHFEEAFDSDQYTDLPEDWLIVATDISGSTKAIDDGRYKEVNTLGATAIISAINACQPEAICFQFGGDGALLAAPANCLDKLTESMNELCEIAELQFQMSMRVSIWRVKDFYAKGLQFRVLKYDLAPAQHIFMFQGSGVEASDRWLKETSEAENLFTQRKSELTLKYLNGLECRWNPLRAKHGKMVTGLIKVRNERKSTPILSQIHQLLDSEHDTSPIRLNTLPTKWPPVHYYAEWKTKTAGDSKPRAYLNFFVVMSFLFFINPIVWLFKAKIPYLGDLVIRSDYQKYDGMYRFVRDLNKQQSEDLYDLCKRLYDKGDIFYGLHESSEAL
ncbi:MAG: DUF3095 family protein, partial [Pseudomonadota bacterium]